MLECIKEKEDREFTTSIGNWQGDSDWIPGPYKGKTGIMHFFCPNDTHWYHSALTYPHFKAQRNNELFFTFLFAPGDEVQGSYSIIPRISDGTTEIDLTYNGALDLFPWTLFYYSTDIPPSFNIGSVLLSLNFINNEYGDKNFYIDYVSAQQPPPLNPQFLPILGVG